MWELCVRHSGCVWASGLTQQCTRYTHENWDVHHFPVFSTKLQFYYFKIKQHSITLPLKSLTFSPWTPRGSITSLQLPHSFVPSGPLSVFYMSCFLQSYYTISRGQPSPVGPFWGTFLGTWVFLLIWRGPPYDRLLQLVDVSLSPDTSSLSLQWETTDWSWFGS